VNRPATIATATATIALMAGAPWAGASPSQQVGPAVAGSSSSATDDNPSASDLLEDRSGRTSTGALAILPRPTPSASPSSSTPSDDPTPGDDAPLPGEVVATRDAAGVGTVTVAASGLSVRLVGSTATQGWSAVVERSSGQQVEVSFRGPEGRVDVHAEVDDGQLRIRVRDRRTGLRTEEHVGDGAGPVVRREADDTTSSSGSGSGADDDRDDLDDSVDSVDSDDSDDTSSVDSDDTSSVDSDDTSGDD